MDTKVIKEQQGCAGKQWENVAGKGQILLLCRSFVPWHSHWRWLEWLGSVVGVQWNC